MSRDDQSQLVERFVQGMINEGDSASHLERERDKTQVGHCRVVLNTVEDQ